MTLENAENGSGSSNGRVLKIWAVAATVLEELGELRSAGPVGQEALEAKGCAHRTREITASQMRLGCSSP